MILQPRGLVDDGTYGDYLRHTTSSANPLSSGQSGLDEARKQSTQDPSAPTSYLDMKYAEVTLSSSLCTSASLSGPIPSPLSDEDHRVAWKRSRIASSSPPSSSSSSNTDGRMGVKTKGAFGYSSTDTSENIYAHSNGGRGDIDGDDDGDDGDGDDDGDVYFHEVDEYRGSRDAAEKENEEYRISAVDEQGTLEDMEALGLGTVRMDNDKVDEDDEEEEEEEGEDNSMCHHSRSRKDISHSNRHNMAAFDTGNDDDNGGDKHGNLIDDIDHDSGDDVDYDARGGARGGAGVGIGDDTKSLLHDLWDGEDNDKSASSVDRFLVGKDTALVFDEALLQVRTPFFASLPLYFSLSSFYITIVLLLLLMPLCVVFLFASCSLHFLDYFVACLSVSRIARAPYRRHASRAAAAPSELCIRPHTRRRHGSHGPACLS